MILFNVGIFGILQSSLIETTIFNGLANEGKTLIEWVFKHTEVTSQLTESLSK